MHPRDDYIRALAKPLAAISDFSAAFPSEREAAAFFYAHIHGEACPACGTDAPFDLAEGRVECPCCTRPASLRSTTPWRGGRLPFRMWLAAVWHVHVADQTITARSFSRRYGLRLATAWDLLHAARDALPFFAPQAQGATGRVLGNCSPGNTAFVTIADDGTGLTAVLAEDGSYPPTPVAPQAAWWLGLLRAWLVEVFRGVTRKHLERYLAEFAARAARRPRPCPGDRKRPRLRGPDAKLLAFA